MKQANSIYLDLKGEKEKVENLNQNNSIHKTNIACSNYFEGYNEKNSLLNTEIPIHPNSIYGINIIAFNNARSFIPNKLLEETCKYGFELFKICNKNFKVPTLDITTNIIDKNVILNALHKSDTEKILKVWLKWCKIYGFPIEPIKYEFLNGEESYCEFTFEKICILSVQVIIVYLLNTFYDDITFFCNTKKQYEDFEESDITKLKRINKFCRLFDISIPNINNLEITEISKNKIKTKILKNIIVVLNSYSCCFQHSTEKYFSYIKGKVYYQPVYENIFDICWDLIAFNYSHIKSSTTKCISCGAEIPVTTDRKYCDNCASNRKPFQETQNKKRNLIKEILNFASDNELVEDEEFKSQLLKYAHYIYERGYSINFKKLTLKELEQFYNELRRKAHYI